MYTDAMCLYITATGFGYNWMRNRWPGTAAAAAASVLLCAAVPRAQRGVTWPGTEAGGV